MSSTKSGGKKRGAKSLEEPAASTSSASPAKTADDDEPMEEEVKERPESEEDQSPSKKVKPVAMRHGRALCQGSGITNPAIQVEGGFQFVIYFYGDDVDHADIEATAINIHDPTEGWEASFKSETLGLMDLLEALGKKGKVTMKPAGTDTSLVVTTAKGDIVLPLRRLSPVDATASANIFVMNSLNRMRADQAMSQMMTQLFAPQQSLALPGGPGGILQMLLTR